MLGRVHLITDSRPGADPVRQVRSVLSAATGELVIQFRPADDWPDRLVYYQALEILAMTSDLGVPVLVNDRVDIALAAEASGAHVGAQDLPVAVARRLLGPVAVLGATARDAPTARQAMLDGATYVGVGPCFQSSTKDGLPRSTRSVRPGSGDPLRPGDRHRRHHAGTGPVAAGRRARTGMRGGRRCRAMRGDPARALADLLDAAGTRSPSLRSGPPWRARDAAS